MNMFYDRKPCITVDDVIQSYNDAQMASPTRSTLPLLTWVKHRQDMVKSLLVHLGLLDCCDLHFEFTVNPTRGRGYPSCTDLMVIAGDSSLAIEAKWTEPPYETVSEWKGSEKNRSQVLAGWLDLLQKHAGHALQPQHFDGAIYQMVHRAASACAAGNDPKMAYVIFEPSTDSSSARTARILSDLAHLRGLLGAPDKIPFYLVTIPLVRTAAFALVDSLEKGKPHTGAQIKSALLGIAPLFDFGSYSVTMV